MTKGSKKTDVFKIFDQSADELDLEIKNDYLSEIYLPYKIYPHQFSNEHYISPITDPILPEWQRNLKKYEKEYQKKEAEQWYDLNFSKKRKLIEDLKNDPQSVVIKKDSVREVVEQIIKDHDLFQRTTELAVYNALASIIMTTNSLDYWSVRQSHQKENGLKFVVDWYRGEFNLTLEVVEPEYLIRTYKTYESIPDGDFRVFI